MFWSVRLFVAGYSCVFVFPFVLGLPSRAFCAYVFILNSHSGPYVWFSAGSFVWWGHRLQIPGALACYRCRINIVGVLSVVR